MIKIYTDGGSRGNPGPSAIGVVVLDVHGGIIHTISKNIGWTTNNVSEYTAVLEAISWICHEYKKNQSDKIISVYTDSQLVYSQLTGLFKVKNQNLKKLLLKIKQMEGSSEFEIKYFHIPRDKNTRADGLVNKALDLLMK